MNKAAFIIVILLMALPARAETPDFFADLDWTSFAGIGVKHNGRVIPLESYAEYFTVDLHGTSPLITGTGETVEPMAVLFEAVFDPERAMEWCTVAIDGDSLPRLAGEMLEEVAFGATATDNDAERARNLARTEARLSLIVFANEELRLVPGVDDKPWRSVAESGDAEFAPLFDRLGVAWRVGETQTIRAAISELGSKLRESQANAGVRGWALRLERTIEAIPLLSIAVLFYVVGAAIAAVGAVRLARLPILIGLSVHLTAVFARAIVLDRLPIQNHFESMIAVAAMLAVVGSLLSRKAHGRELLSISALIAASLLAVAEWLEVPGRVLELEAGILSSTAILKYHVLTILAGYALILLGAGVGGGVILQRFRGATLEEGGRLHRLQVSLGFWIFWVLGLGIFLGAVWADRAWGRWWAFDPKETWALITWLVYLAMVHIPVSKISVRRQPIVIAILHLVGLLTMLWTYFGVNLLLASLHSYA